jgi:hypothetical protein
MTKLFKEIVAALGGPESDLAKRFSKEHREGVKNAAIHLGKAMHVHKRAAVEHKGMMKAHGEGMEDCAKAMDEMDKAHAVMKAHKECCGKAATSSESHRFPHEQVAGHLEAAKAAMGKALGEDMPKVSKMGKAVHEGHGDTNDQHELTKGAITKVASSWVGEESESPAAAGAGYTPSQAGYTSNMPQSTVAGGDVEDTNPFGPMYDFKESSARPGNGGGHVTEAEANLRVEKARLEGELAATRKALEDAGNRPGPTPGGRLFGGGTQPNASSNGSTDSLMQKAFELGRISKYDLDHMELPEVRERVSRIIIGLQCSIGDPGFQKADMRDASFMRPITDLRGDHEAINKRALNVIAQGAPSVPGSFTQ